MEPEPVVARVPVPATRRCDAGPEARLSYMDDAYPGMAWILGGTFRMGSDRHYPEVRVDGFWMDMHTVTNEEFRRFVDALDQRQAVRSWPTGA
jgi:formylglycine-generating enzyme required for sulfatase activity